MDYHSNLGLSRWSYEDLAIARQHLIVWLATHGGTKGIMYQGTRKVGFIEKTEGTWVWKPRGKKSIYKVNPASGNLSTKLE